MNKVKWLQSPNVSLIWALVCVLVWISLFFAVAETKIVDDLDSKVSLPAYFRFRDNLDKSPKLNKKIKVYTIDDSTVAWLGSPNMTMEQWVSLLLEIDQRNPKAVFIDGMFSIANIPPGREEASEKAIKSLANIKTKIVVGSFAAATQVPFRSNLDLSDPKFQLEKYLYLQGDLKHLAKSVAAQLNLVKSRSKFIYGPDPILRPYFTHIGQILYAGNNRFIPFLRVDSKVAIPHLMIYADDEPRFHKGNLYLRKAKVPTYSDGSVPINFSNFRYYLSNTTPLRGLLSERHKKNYLGKIDSGDYIYIIPPFYTGNTDFKQTPFGSMPGGYTHLAVLNSILNQDWISPVDQKHVFVVIAAFLGAVCALKVNSIGLALIMIFGVSSWFMVAMYLFAYKSILVPLLFPAVAFVGPLVTIFIEKTRVAEKKSQYIRNALDGAIRPRELDALSKAPDKVNFEARERVVTVMFIDVVGFSILAENQLPRIAFDSLKSTLSEISALVHEYNGIVNKNLGDGLLCFFGYSLEEDETSFDHAEKALECAVRIQRENVPKMITAHENRDPVYPLRIGINTSSVYLGNLGSENRIDFTVVGNGVNFAKRLEGACEPHAVLMGATTWELIEPLGVFHEGVKKRLVEIKHHDEMVESWQFDPFHDDSSLKSMAEKAYEQSFHRVRSEKRWKVPDPRKIILTSNMGTGELLNFSTTGLSIKLSGLLVKGAVLTLSLDSLDGKLKDDLESMGLAAFSIEVRWAIEESKGYLHGVRYRYMSAEQAKFVVDKLVEYTHGRPEQGDRGGESASSES